MRSALSQSRTQAGRRTPLSRFAVLLLFLLLTSNAAQSDKFAEHEVRAAYLYNFSLFVRWPDSAFDNRDSEFRYCVLGDRKLAETLSRVLRGETVRGRNLRLMRAEIPDQWRRCHLLYLDGSVQGMLPRLLQAIQGAPVFTVGEYSQLVEAGAMAALARKGRRIKPVIHRQRVEDAGIRVSSKLLRLSTLVEGGEP